MILPFDSARRLDKNAIYQWLNNQMLFGFCDLNKGSSAFGGLSIMVMSDGALLIQKTRWLINQSMVDTFASFKSVYNVCRKSDSVIRHDMVD